MTQRAMSLKTYACVNRSTYMTPGRRATSGIAALLTSTRTMPLWPKEYEICCAPNADKACNVWGRREGSKTVISRVIVELAALASEDPIVDRSPTEAELGEVVPREARDPLKAAPFGALAASKETDRAGNPRSARVTILGGPSATPPSRSTPFWMIPACGS